MKRKLAFAALYSIFGFVTYLFFLYVTFPSDVARGRLIYEANKAGVRMQLVDFKPAWPWGITLKGVDIYSFSEPDAAHKPHPIKPPRPPIGPGGAPGGPGPEGTAAGGTVAGNGPGGAVAGHADAQGAPAAAAAAAEVPVLTLDRLRIPTLLPLLMPAAGGMGKISFDADLYGGTLAGSYAQESGFSKIIADLADFDFAKYPFAGETLDLKLGGRMGIKTDLSVSREKIRESTGSVAMTFSGLAVHKGSKVQGFDIPLELTFKPVSGTMDIKNGRAELSEMTFESAPVTLVLSGTIMLNQVLSRSRFNLKVAMKFGDELKLVSALLPESAKSDDGFYHYIISGPYNNLRPRPDRLAARRKPGGRPTPSTPVAGPTEPLERSGPNNMPHPNIPGLPGPMAGLPPGLEPSARPPVLDDAERERLREERRQRAEERRKRREEMRQQRLNSGMDDGMPMAPPVPRGIQPNMPGMDSDGTDGERPTRRVQAYDANENQPPDAEPMDPGNDPGGDPQQWQDEGTQR